MYLKCHDHAAYLVDALIDTNPMMKDWKTMADLLLSGEGFFFPSIYLLSYIFALISERSCLLLSAFFGPLVSVLNGIDAIC